MTTCKLYTVSTCLFFYSLTSLAQGVSKKTVEFKYNRLPLVAFDNKKVSYKTEVITPWTISEKRKIKNYQDNKTEAESKYLQELEDKRNQKSGSNGV